MARTKTKYKVFKGKGKDKTKMRGMDTVLFNMILVLLCFLLCAFPPLRRLRSRT